MLTSQLEREGDLRGLYILNIEQFNLEIKLYLEGVQSMTKRLDDSNEDEDEVIRFKSKFYNTIYKFQFYSSIDRKGFKIFRNTNFYIKWGNQYNGKGGDSLTLLSSREKHASVVFGNTKLYQQPIKTSVNFIYSIASW